MKLDRKQNLNVVYQVCIFGPIRKPRWPPWLLIGWEIFNFSSETAERNSTKLGRKQGLNILYQVCFSSRSENGDGRPSFWLADTFWTFPLKLLNRNRQNLTESKITTSSTKCVADGKTKMASLVMISGDAPTVILNYVAAQQNKSYHWIIDIYIYLN